MISPLRGFDRPCPFRRRKPHPAEEPVSFSCLSLAITVENFFFLFKTVQEVGGGTHFSFTADEYFFLKINGTLILVKHEIIINFL